MTTQRPYQAILGMVIGLSALSFLLKQPLIAYAVLTLAFLSLASERFGSFIVRGMHAVIGFVFGLILKVILALVYILLITPIAVIRSKKKQSEAWHEGKASDKKQMTFTW
jgi:uncharacterized membrane protein